MSGWRRRAIVTFPEFRHRLENPGFTSHDLFAALLALSRRAHLKSDEESLKRIYSFVEWCSDQGHDLRRAAGVSFYEHLSRSS